MELKFEFILGQKSFEIHAGFLKIFIFHRLLKDCFYFYLGPWGHVDGEHGKG